MSLLFYFGPYTCLWLISWHTKYFTLQLLILRVQTNSCISWIFVYCDFNIYMVATVQIAYILSYLDNLATHIPSMQVCHGKRASFPGSPLAPTKNKNWGGEPGIDSHVISQHDTFPLETSLTQNHSSCEVFSGQEFVTTTRFLLCSYLGALRCDILYASIQC